MWKSVGGPEMLPVEDERVCGNLVGRERESGDLRELLADHRLVTVSGEAGVGKSRLAAHTVAAMARGTWQRIVHVRWSGTRPGITSELTAAICHASTGAQPSRGTADIGWLVRHLRTREVLLVLDDIAPVHSASVGTVQTLLGLLPRLRVLVTSRRALGLGEERVLRLQPLSTESPDEVSALAPAVELFLDRARAAQPGFTADDAQLTSIGDICRSVDGVPLAIKLAAAQVARHELSDLAQRLEREQCWLSSQQALPARHRSLRKAIGAVYTLCERAERIVWSRASVFVGTFNESTAVFMCAGRDIAPHDVPSALCRLAAVGVLEPVSDTGGLNPTRYRMGRAARDFGKERLGQAGELGVAMERYIIHCRHMAAVAENLWSAGSQPQAVQLVQDEQDNLMAMLAQGRNHPDHAEAALDAVVNLWFWWVVYDGAEQGRRHLEQLLPLCPRGSSAATRGLCLAAWLTACRDPQAASALLAQAWPAAVLAGDDATIGRIAHIQGMLALHHGDTRAAAEHFQEAGHTIPPLAPGGPSSAVSLAALAVTQASFAPRAARRNARRALAQPDIRNDTWACFIARFALAAIDQRQGRSARAWRRAQKVLETLDNGLPAPHGVAALRQLITDIEGGDPRQAAMPLPTREHVDLRAVLHEHQAPSLPGPDHEGKHYSNVIIGPLFADHRHSIADD